MSATVHTRKVVGSNNGSPSDYTYINNTGGNVRAIVYWLYGGAGPAGKSVSLRWGNLSGVDRCEGNLTNDDLYGKYLVVTGPSNLGKGSNDLGVPLEFILADGHGFYVYCEAPAGWCEYSIVTIPE